MKQKVLAIIQARMKSSRLPDKVMLDIQGKPMLTRVIERVRLARHIDRVIVATTTGEDEDPIAELCKETGIDCYRGSLQDVLDRYYQAAKPHQPDILVRITADCPLIDPGLIDETVNVMIGSGTTTAIWKPQADAEKYTASTAEVAWDYASTRLPPPWHRTFPIGLDVEACRFLALERAWKEATAPFEREHVMPYFYDLPNRFRCIVADWPVDLGFHRWTVDTEADLALIREVFTRLGDSEFTWLDVLALFEKDPDLIKMNLGTYHKDFREVDSPQEPVVAEIVLFSAPKPFTNPHIAMIQRNAIRSWQQLGDRVEVLLLGEEDGMAEAARDLGVRHITQLRRTESGTPLISSMLEEARKASDAPIMAIINADIILLPGFVESISKVAEEYSHFLLLGHRWDLDLREPIDFSSGWDTVLRGKIDLEGKLHKSKGSDYFAFRREDLHPYPDFAIGRAGWDNWTIYHASAQGWPVIDATHDIVIAHQQHDYSHLPGGVKHYTHPESDYNLRLAGGKRYIFTLLDANRVLVDGRILPYPKTWRKLLLDFERYPVLHSGSRFWMDVFFYLTHPVKFIRHKFPGIARIFGLKRPLEDDD